MTNPLRHFTDLPHFDQITPDHCDEAVDDVLAQAEAAIAAIAADASAPDWHIVMAPMETALEAIGRVWNQIEHMHSVMSSPEWRAAHQRNLAKLAAFYARLGQNEAIYTRVNALSAAPTTAALPAGRQKIIADSKRDFELSGVALPPAQKTAFRQNSERLAALGAQFEEKLLAATQAFSLTAEESDLGEMPPDLRAIAQNSAREHGETGYRFTLQPPSYMAFMQYAANRDQRRRMYRAYVTRASEHDDPTRDNTPIAAEILALRQRQAALLGVPSYADLALKTRMAASPTTAADFLQDLLTRAKPHAAAEMAQLKQFAADHLAIPDLQAWDASYAAEKLKRARFNFSDADLRPYLREDRILRGMFDCLGQLFGIRLHPHPAAVWHPDVRYMQLRDADATVIGGVYLDLYSRENKRGGAWMADALSRFRRPDGLQLPVAHVTCNFSKPVGDSPALLDWNEVVTLFHEFGHAMHHLLTEIDDYATSGISGVEWDAVELPSQWLENFVWEWQTLQNMTAHLDTGAPLPRALYDKAIAARRFHSGLWLIRQLEFALFDLGLHDGSASDATPLEIHRRIREHTAVLPIPDYNRFYCGFSHIFAGGYAAGYYSYLWAEVLAADIFTQFQQSGTVLNRALGAAFRREVLAVGGSRPAMQSFQAMRGRAPDIAPLLTHYGLSP